MDLLSGGTKSLTFFTSQNVTIHKTKTENAEKVYLKQAGNILRPYYEDYENIKMIKHEITLNCDNPMKQSFSEKLQSKIPKAHYDICISGVGWFSIKGKGIVQLFLHLPKGVSYTIRDSLLPYEIFDKGIYLFKEFMFVRIKLIFRKYYPC